MTSVAADRTIPLGRINNGREWLYDYGNGNTVNLASIRQVRVEVLTGRAEIDGFAVVPEPSTWALGALGLGALAIWRRRQS